MVPGGNESQSPPTALPKDILFTNPLKCPTTYPFYILLMSDRYNIWILFLGLTSCYIWGGKKEIASLQWDQEIIKHEQIVIGTRKTTVSRINIRLESWWEMSELKEKKEIKYNTAPKDEEMKDMNKKLRVMKIFQHTSKRNSWMRKLVKAEEREWLKKFYN